ncbi:hypothetical protein ACFRKE_37945, partial [Kitasatospora indigofera]
MQRSRRPGTDPDAGWLAAVLDSAFLLLLAASLVRYLSHHPGNPRVPWVLGLSAALAVAQPAGSWLLRTRPAGAPPGPPPPPRARADNPPGPPKR